MIDYDFQKSLGYWVGLTAATIEAAMNDELAGTGITMRQVQVLACVALCGQLIQSELAAMVHVEPSTMVRILDRMERDGWIVRVPSPTDRRKKVVQATNKVKPHWKRIVECGERMEKRATRGLSKAQLNQLRDTLAMVRSNLHKGNCK